MDAKTDKSRQSNQLIFLGVLLFFLGLVVGLVIPLLANPRMALSSHIEGVLNGIFLIVLGLIWDRMALSSGWLRAIFWLSVYGTFTNWLGILIAAVFDAGKNLNVAAGGREGSPVAEAVVNFCLITLTIAMMTVSMVVLTGLYRYMKNRS